MVEKTKTHNSQSAVPHRTTTTQTHQLRSKKEKKFTQNVSVFMSLTIKSKYRKKAAKLFDKNKYNYRSLIESVNSAIKRTLGSYVCSRRADNQQKQVTIKAIAYNLEQVGRTIKMLIFINC